MKEQDLYSIGQVAKICHISVKTLRYYDTVQVLIPLVRRESSQYRYYSKAQLIKACMIRQLRDSGFSLSSIRELLTKDSLCTKVLNLEQRVKENTREILALEKLRQANQELLARLKEGQRQLRKHRCLKEEAVFQVERIPLIHLLGSRAMMPSYHNEEVNLERWIEIGEQARALKIKATGPVFITFHTEFFGQFISKCCDVEFALQVEEKEKKLSAIKPFGNFSAATTVHCGPYNNIIKTYIGLKRWMDERNMEAAGPVTEMFLVSPLDTGKSKEHVTKIIVPLKNID